MRQLFYNDLRRKSLQSNVLKAAWPLLPLALASGEGSAMQQPLAIAIVSGWVVQLPLVLMLMSAMIAALRLD